MFFIAFWSLKQAKNEGELGIVHGKARLKLNYIKNPTFGELRSLCQINQVCKEENQRRNLTFNNFATLCEIFPSLQIAQEEYKLQDRELEVKNEFYNPLWNFHKPERISQALQNLPIIFRYFCNDSVRFLSQDILCNYLFSPCNQINIILDI